VQICLIKQAVKHRVDILLGETLSRAKEAEIIARIAQKANIPLWISFTCTAGSTFCKNENSGLSLFELLH
jgi:S-methylmethionine-dependent homocysteine/selenocysteine methylase